MTPNNAETLRFSAYGNPNEEIQKIQWLYYPTHHDKFITICVENEYRLWGEVFELILSHLVKYGIGVISIAKGKDANIRYGQNANGIALAHAAYLMDNALCHVCASDWSLTLAMHNGLSPVFVKTAESRLIYDQKAYASGVDEKEKPEVLADAIMEKLGLPERARIQTLHLGESYGETFVELVPDFSIKDTGINASMNIGVRCDLVENWDFVLHLLGKGARPTIIANSIPPKQMLSFMKGVAKMNFWVNENISPAGLKQVEDLGIPYTLLSRSDDIPDIKQRLFDFKPIKTIEPFSKIWLDKLKSFSYDTRIKSKRPIVSKDGTFLSVYHWREGFPNNTKQGSLLMDGATDEDFINESDLFIYHKITE